MKNDIPPVVAILAVVVLLALVVGAFVYFTGTNSLTPAQQETRETLIRARQKEAERGVSQRGPAR
jgi:lipopolysaccharide export LptBFGC system permease protein LptF